MLKNQHHLWRCTLLKLMMFLVCSTGFSQAISVDGTSYTTEDLVSVLLNNACAEVSNIQLSSPQAVAYFNNQGGNFPISEGVLIRSGKAQYTAGNYTGLNLSSQLNSNSDTTLVQINAATGQSTSITDVAYLQFDFVPLSNNFEFNFLFASNEYGEWQCLSSDVFAFLLTDLSTGTTTNLALIPGTNDPISVRNIKDNTYNPSCSSVNPDLFSTYTVTNPAASSINMRGYSVVMNAATGIVPGNSYRIRLVIGDAGDANFDSAIFLAAGSFETSINLGADRTICSGDTQTLSTGLDASVYQHVWSRNGVNLPVTTSSITVNQSGTYKVTVTKNGTACAISDEVVLAELMVTQPEDLMTCYSESGNYTYDLTSNDISALEVPNNYQVFYYASMADVTAQNEIPNANLTAYQSAGNQTIYIKLFNTDTEQFCTAVYSFQLNVNPPFNLNHSPEPIEICAAPSSVVNLNDIIPNVLNGQSQSNFNFSFFESQSDAENNTNAISTPAAYTLQSATSVTLWLRVEDEQMPECYVVLSFQIIINELPPVDQITNQVACSSFQLPSLTNGTYYTGPNASGQVLAAGDVIDQTQLIYIFSGPNENGCVNQSHFKVTMADEYEIDTTHCGKYIVPDPPAGQFYTAPDGPSGSGTVLSPGMALTTSQTIYYYVEFDGVLCRDQAFNITIYPLPEVDQPTDVITCSQYVLPTLTNGNYYTQANGNGTQLNAGDIISSSQTLYVFNDDGRCTNQHQFHISIIPDFEDITACGSFVLPDLEVGGYYTQASGAGQAIPEGTTLTSSQVVYYYAQTTTTPNCTENTSFQVTINPIPEVDELEDVVTCEDVGYVLPPLTNGAYFTDSNRTGTQLFAGDTITTSQTLYINNLENGCTNETDFNVEVYSLPPVEQFTDIYSCEPFELPELTNGDFYTGPAGTGTLLPAGTTIDSTQLIYIYNDYPELTSCYSESFFTVYINGVSVDSFENITTCDYYVLPDLTTGNYFTESGGEGLALYAGDTLTTTQEVFVYAINGDRFPCIDETSFTVDISQTPVLDTYSDIEKCGSYTLAQLTQNDSIAIDYYRSPFGEDKILPEDYTFDTPGTYTIYVYATAANNENCFAQTSFQLTVHPLLELAIDGGTICTDRSTDTLTPVVLSSGLDPNEFTVNWYLNGELRHTGPNFEATEAGVYSVETEKLAPEQGANCNYAPTTVEVFESAQPVIDAHVSQPFSDIAVITVDIVDGVGAYEYQLDGGSYQTSNEFYDVESGSHMIRVRGIHGTCGATVIAVEVLKFPKFFTPNADGFNDKWTIKDLRNHPEAQIHIFDRYGKLLKTFSPQYEGWDGTFNGKPMPSNDYWFLVKFEQEGVKKIFKSHFTLKR